MRKLIGLPDVEFQTLLACIRTRLYGRSVDLSAVREAEIDWTELVSLAIRHKIAPLLQSCQKQLHGFTELESARLNIRCRSILAKNFELTRQLQSIHQTFTHAGIPLLAIKGPTLAIELHGGLQHRQFSDLDVLIRPEDLAQSLRLFQDLGYKVDGPDVRRLTESRMQKFAARSKELSLVRHSDGRVSFVDLHWGLSDDSQFFETDHAALFDAGCSCDIGGTAVCTAPAEFQIVYLALHAISHQCARLSWLFDFAVALNRMNEVQLQGFLQSQSLANRRIVICAMLMLERLGLFDGLDAVLDDAAKWRRVFAVMIQAMFESVSRREVKMLNGAYANGVWKWRLTGRLRPFANSLATAFSPAAEDWLVPRWYGPYVNRAKYLLAIAMNSIARVLRVQKDSTIVEESGEVQSAEVLHLPQTHASVDQDHGSRAA